MSKWAGVIIGSRGQFSWTNPFSSSNIGSYLLTGYWTPLSQQSVEVRGEVMERWRTSFLPQLNSVFKQTTNIGKLIFSKASPTYATTAGFPTVPADGGKKGTNYEYQFIQIPAAWGNDVFHLETDVMIVGSGCGGGVCAKNLAEAGHDVIVADKGYYFPPSQFPMNETDGNWFLYENGGAVSSMDGKTSFIAGSTWGGGGTVNWSACLQTQSFVRREWSEERGLGFFATQEFQHCMDRVCDRMGVSSDHIRHNHANQTILEGSRKLGYTAKPVPQNTGGNEHYCGRCTMGCGSAEKQGPAVSWLPDAGKAGARFMEGFKVEHVIFDESSGTKVATGVKGVWTSRNSTNVNHPEPVVVREVIIKAKKVVISCGTLWSPIVLMNSGLKVFMFCPVLCSRLTSLEPPNRKASTHSPHKHDRRCLGRRLPTMGR